MKLLKWDDTYQPPFDNPLIRLLPVLPLSIFIIAIIVSSGVEIINHDTKPTFIELREQGIQDFENNRVNASHYMESKYGSSREKGYYRGVDYALEKEQLFNPNASLKLHMI